MAVKPIKDIIASFVLPVKLHDTLQTRAEKEKRSLSQIVRFALEEYLKGEK